MSKLTRVAAAAALALGAFAGGQAVAGPVCNSCEYTGNTYLGQHNPTTGEGAGFQHTFGILNAPLPPFSDVWVFDFAPAGNFQLNASWQTTPNGITGFGINLYQLAVNPTCGALGTSCAPANILAGAALIGSAVEVGVGLGLYNLPSQVLQSGWYAFQAVGTVTGSGQQTRYSGQIGTSRIPEPATLGLVGVALLGAAAMSRRSRKI